MKNSVGVEATFRRKDATARLSCPYFFVFIIVCIVYYILNHQLNYNLTFVQWDFVSKLANVSRNIDAINLVSDGV